MEIKLNDILQISDNDKKDWTICLCNPPKEGIYSFTSDNEKLLEQISWKKHANKKYSFRIIETKYCLQFIRLEKDKKMDQWLFLGAFEIDNELIKKENGDELYKLIPMDKFSGLVERMIVRFARISGPKGVKYGLDRVDDFTVVKILEKKYINTFKKFDGYNNVTLSFEELETIVSENIDEWRIALTNVNCVYVITDKKEGKIYIGSTYGCDGIWGRWMCYVKTEGTGHNLKLEEILDEMGSDYIRKNFTWSILECFYNSDSKGEQIREREKHWKKIFNSKESGYNGN